MSKRDRRQQRFNKSNNDQSVAIGNRNTSDGENSVAIGSGNTSLGERSFASGSETNSRGFASSTLGHRTIAYSRGETALGSFNTTYTPLGGSNSWHTSDRALVVGRGTHRNLRKDAFTVFKNGNATLAGALTQSSDKRLKENIKPLKNASERLNKINGYTYNWNKEAQRSEKLQYGVIAQEIMAEFPELVSKDSEGFYGVNYSGLIPVLIAALKEEKQARKDEISTLRDEMEEIKNLIKKCYSKENINPESDLKETSVPTELLNVFSQI